MTMSVGVGRTFKAVCLFVCPPHNSKMNNPKMFKLDIGMTLGYPTNHMVLGLKGQRSRLGLGLEFGYGNTAWVRTNNVGSAIGAVSGL